MRRERGVRADGVRADGVCANDLSRGDGAAGRANEAPFLDADVTVEFPLLTVGVHLRAARGDIVGLVGPNGAGKTTVLRAIAGLEAIDGGRITIGTTVVDDPAAGILVVPQRRRVGVVFQDYRLFPHLSALDNVAFGLRCRSGERTGGRKGARRIASAWLDRLDLRDHADQKPAALSGGQAQRVALARALATEPDVLLLDEPLGAIDPAARGRIRDDLARYLAGFAGVTILVSHEHDDIRALAGQATVLESGRVAWSGAATALNAVPFR